MASFGCSLENVIGGLFQYPLTGGSISYSTGNTENSQVVWQYWNEGVQTAVSSGNVVYYQQQINAQWQDWNFRLAQERAAREQRQRQYQGQPAVPPDEASKKAEALLFLYLTEKQKKQYKEHGYFETEVNDRVYRISKGWAGNISEYNKAGRRVASLCVHPRESVPYEDNMLAQLLALHANEDEFRRVANITRY